MLKERYRPGLILTISPYFIEIIIIIARYYIARVQNNLFDWRKDYEKEVV
jgi:hypothetical protein